MNYRRKMRRFQKLGHLVDKWRNRWEKAFLPDNLDRAGNPVLSARYQAKYDAAYATYCHLYMNPAYPYGSFRNL